MNRARLGIGVLLLVVAVGAALYSKQQEDKATGALKAAQRKPYAPPPPPPRPWRWATESEWVVHQVVRTIAEWTMPTGASAPAVTEIKVQRQERSMGAGKFDIHLQTSAGPQKVTIAPPLHVWDPQPYAAVAASLLGGGATTVPAEPSPTDPDIAALILASDTQSLRQADALLFAALTERPRDPLLHEKAAWLWTAQALRESAGSGDRRPSLNGATAHLALARVLRNGTAPGFEAELAAVAMDALMFRQTDAMEGIAKIEASSPDTVRNAWSNAVRIRITHDPRSVLQAKPATRIEQMEGLIAVSRSRGCDDTLALSVTWRMRPAADWVRASLSCADEEFQRVIGDPVALQFEDAARLIDETKPGGAETMNRLKTLAVADTHQPTRPQAIIPATQRANAGLTHVVGAIELMGSFLSSRARRESLEELMVMSAALRENLPQRASLEWYLESLISRSYMSSPGVCDGMVRLIADRPDLMRERDWGTVRYCSWTPALKMVPEPEWRTSVFLPGTGLYGAGPWRQGPAQGPVVEDAVARAPWEPGIGRAVASVKYQLEVPSTEFVRIHEKVWDYDVDSIMWAISGIDDDDGRVRQLAERACELDVAKCATAAGELSVLGMDEAAEPLWKRAIAGWKSPIGLANELGRYINSLLDKGDVKQALQLAQRTEQVYSYNGIFNLAFTYERLGRFEEAAAEHAKIVARYRDRETENRFYIRHAQRHGAAPFEKQTALALAEVFPRGVRKKTLAELKAGNGHPPCVTLGMETATIDRRLRRLGLTRAHCVASVDGYAVETESQFDAVLGFTDDPNITIVARRQAGTYPIVELKGSYRRWNYGLLNKDAAGPPK